MRTSVPSLLQPGNSIAATIANEFTEADSPIYLSSLIALGFLLFVVTFVVLAIARVMLNRLARRAGEAHERWKRRQARCHRQRLGDPGHSVWSVLAGLDTLDHREQRLPALKWGLFTQMTPPPGAQWRSPERLCGSIEMCGLAILIGTPIGIGAGTYLAEYARHTKLGAVIRFVNDILLSAPSIVIGLFHLRTHGRPHGAFLRVGRRGRLCHLSCCPSSFAPRMKC